MLTFVLRWRIYVTTDLKVIQINAKVSTPELQQKVLLPHGLHPVMMKSEPRTKQPRTSFKY